MGNDYKLDDYCSHCGKKNDTMVTECIRCKTDMLPIGSTFRAQKVLVNSKILPAEPNVSLRAVNVEISS